MALRQYTIRIKPLRKGLNLQPDILTIFGCCISDPSGFVIKSTGKRGLAFTDQNGIPINHPVFRHLANIPKIAP
jgi:hypothetical protein